VLGNETTGQRQWQGVIKFVAIHNRALTAAQIQQNFAAGVGQKFYLLFGVSSLTGVAQSYILFRAASTTITAISSPSRVHQPLDPNAKPANLPLSGMRIGVNGTLAPSGQSFATLSATVGGANYGRQRPAALPLDRDPGDARTVERPVLPVLRPARRTCTRTSSRPWW
jgi:hypothetical protein